jgi:hypothetical protein
MGLEAAMNVKAFLLSSALLAFHVACSIAEPPAFEPGQGGAENETKSEKGEKSETGESGKADEKGTSKPSSSTTNGGSGDKCPYDGKPLDVSGFAKCLDGGRCVPSAAIPEKERGRLAACSGGLCVPEKIIANKGLYLPKTCTSIAGSEGRCFSTVFPDIEKQKGEIPVDVCDANERCAPCFDPTNGTETGACSSVSCDAPKKPKAVFKDCCGARAKCIPVSSIPASGRDSLQTRDCESDQRCVPNEQINGETPSACKGEWGGFFDEYDGVCISDCAKPDDIGGMAVSKGNCKAGFFCAPCKDPLDRPTGAPGCK